jgi:hypothetical protein
MGERNLWFNFTTNSNLFPLVQSGKPNNLVRLVPDKRTSTGQPGEAQCPI